MTTLREKIDALAAPCTCHDDYKRRGREDPSCRHHDEQDAALAAARLALEHAAKHCDRVARNQRSDWQGRVDGPAECAAAIRLDASTLGSDA